MSLAAILAIDQGTTSSRAIIFDQATRILAQAQEEFPQAYPGDGWVEHDPEAIWSSTVAVARRALAKAEADGYAVAAIGITNQRETTLLWDRASGRTLGNAIVWQDRRTADHCQMLRQSGHEPLIQSRTGLLLDPYFSATKIAWMLDHLPGARGQAEAGKLAFGTVDSFLLWRLTGGKTHATDATNASRTSLFNIHTQDWDDELLHLFRIPRALLPRVEDCAAEFGVTAPGIFPRQIAVRGVVGDQQGAAIGQGCFSQGSIKSTYGTGCFLLVNSGATPLTSRHRMLTTIGYRIGGVTSYALEGSIFVAGAAVQWLRDGLGVLQSAAESAELAAGLADNGGVYMVPAFAGLGAPHWNSAARGVLSGLTRASGRAHLARAALEATAYQTHDLLAAMTDDGLTPAALRVDGGMVANDWLLQFLADIIDIPVDRPVVMETTALGAAYLAGRQSGLYGDFTDFAKIWQADRRFQPTMPAEHRRHCLAGWRRAVGQTLTP